LAVVVPGAFPEPGRVAGRLDAAYKSGCGQLIDGVIYGRHWNEPIFNIEIFKEANDSSIMARRARRHPHRVVRGA
jgi:hypothetical protein